MIVDKNIEPLCYIHYEHKGIFGIGFDFHVFAVTLPKSITFLYPVVPNTYICRRVLFVWRLSHFTQVFKPVVALYTMPDYFAIGWLSVLL